MDSKPELAEDLMAKIKNAGFKLGANIILLIETLYKNQSQKLDELIKEII